MTRFITVKKLSDFPPIREEVAKQMDIDWSRAIMTYGGAIYSWSELPDHLIVHEETHIRQQAEIGTDLWWEKWLNDKQFRFDQEIEAYRNQYKKMKETIKDRNYLHRLLVAISTDLSGPTYGNIISLQEAMKQIKNI